MSMDLMREKNDTNGKSVNAKSDFRFQIVLEYPTQGH